MCNLRTSRKLRNRLFSWLPWVVVFVITSTALFINVLEVQRFRSEQKRRGPVIQELEQIKEEHAEELARRGEWMKRREEWEASMEEQMNERDEDRVYRKEILRLLELNTELQRPKSFNQE